MTRTADRGYLDHILDAIQKIERSAHSGRVAFEADEDAYDAGLRRLQTIAESTQKLSPELMARHPKVPWSQIGGFRNRIVHAYMDVDPELVWRVIEGDLGLLKQMAEQELSAQ